MNIVLFKNNKTTLIENVNHITFSSSKKFVLTFSNNRQRIIEYEEYDYLGIHP